MRRAVLRRLQPRKQPRPRLDPIAAHGTAGDTQDARSLRLGITAEEAAFHHLRQARVEHCKLAKCVIHFQQALVAGKEVLRALMVFQRIHTSATALVRQPAARVIHQRLPHCERGTAQEMQLIHPLTTAMQAQECFMHQRGSAHRFTRPHPPSLAPCTLAQVVQQHWRKRLRSGSQCGVGRVGSL